jgi:tRNA threonylcarbamoyladenosine biosynthesis protein TsaE
LVNEYRCRHLFYHIDLYRLENLSDFLFSGLEEYLHLEGVVVMEWADRWPEILPEQRLDINFEIIDSNRREITINGHHPRAIEIIENL